MAPVSTRKLSPERREDVLVAAMAEFAVGGPERTSTEAIAARAGISQPYVYRLFPTKKALFLAAIERMFDRVEEVLVAAAGTLQGEDARCALGEAYWALLQEEPAVLCLQLQAYAASTSDEEVRATTVRCFGRLWELMAARADSSEEVETFMAAGMLCNVAAALGLDKHNLTTLESTAGPMVTLGALTGRAETG